MTCETANPAGPESEAEDLGDVLREYMDVTNRLQRTHEALQREVIRLRDELASKNRELELRRRLAALGELAAGVAHEVRNPLGAIQLYNNLLRKECRRLEPALELIEKIEAGIRAIDGVVQDTLALAPRAQQVTPKRLASIIASAHDACRQTLATHHVKLRVRLAEPHVCVRAEPDGFQRVLVNLIVNAAEAAPPASTIALQVAPRRDNQVELRITDQGPGLTDEVLERLFDPFFTTKEHGTGLGLTIAHRLVEAYGGHLAVRNRPDQGAEFTVVLPAADDKKGKKTGQDQTRPTHAA